MDDEVVTAEVLTGVRTVPPPWAEGTYGAAWALDCQAAGAPKIGGPKVDVLCSLDMVHRAASPPDGLILWFGAPPETLSLENASEILGSALTHRAAQFRVEADRASFITAHAGLRLILAPLLGCAPGQVTYLPDAHGKPRLCADRHGRAAAAIHFSISHTRGRAAVATAGRPVGVDVEGLRPIADLDGIATSAFAPEALATLRDVPDDQRLRLFYRHWTLGEAFIKATGLGLSQGLASFAFTSEGTPRLLRTTPGWGPRDRWRFGLMS